MWMPFFFLLVDSFFLLTLGAFVCFALRDLAVLPLLVAFVVAAAVVPFNSSAAAASVNVSFDFVGAALVPGGFAGCKVVPVLPGGGSTTEVLSLAPGLLVDSVLAGGLLEDSVGETVSMLSAC